MTEPVRVAESRRQAMARFLGSSAFVALGIWMLLSASEGGPSMRGYLSALIGGVAAVPFFGMLMIRYVGTIVAPGILRIDDSGLHIKRWWQSPSWNWTEIDRAEINRRNFGTFTYCTIYPRTGRPRNLFGWEASPRSIHEAILLHIESNRPRSRA